jgi:guanylate kinase
MTAPLIIVSGPSGCGKSTLVRELLRTSSRPLRVSISATTRPERPGEEDGKHYHFWTRERFECELQAEKFLEHAKVHGDHYYGTPRSEVEPYLAQGTGVILVIDVQGAAQVRQNFPNVYSIFIRVPNDDYRARLDTRGDSEDAIRRRLQTAQSELARANEYSAQLVNDDLNKAVDELRRLVESQFPTLEGDTTNAR